MAMPEPEPRSWSASAVTTLVVCVVLGLLAVALIGGWSALSQHMNDRINQRPAPSVAGTP